MASSLSLSLSFSLCLFLLILAQATASRPECEAHVLSGNAAFESGKFEAALDYLTDAINCDSENLDSYLARARVKHATSKPKPALYDINLVLNKDSGNVDALLFRAQIRKELGQYDDSQDDLDRLSKIESVAAKAKEMSAEVAKARELYENFTGGEAGGHFKDKVRKLSQLIEISPSFIRVLYLRAQLYFESGMYPQVIEDTKRVLRLKSKHVDSLLLRGHTYKYSGEIAMALKHYKACAKQMEEECVDAKKELEGFEKLLEKIKSLVDASQATKALPLIKEALAVDPKLTVFHPQLYLLKCRSHVIKRQGTQALAACEIVISSEPTNADALLQHGEALLLIGGKAEIEKAQRSFQKALDNGAGNAAHDALNRAKRALYIASRKNYYKLLGIEKTASQRAIRKAYKKAALKYHPDKLKKSGLTKEEAAAAYKDVQEAYEVLSDEDMKKRWDRGEDVFAKPQGFNPFQGSQGFNPFSQFFRRG